MNSSYALFIAGMKNCEGSFFIEFVGDILPDMTLPAISGLEIAKKVELAREWYGDAVFN